MGLMPKSWQNNRVVIVALLAALGVLLVYVPGKVIDLYDRVKGLGSPYIYIYWAMVASGAAILVVRTGGIIVNLWRATRDKALRSERRVKNPSQLSAEEKEREVADNLAAVGQLHAEANLPDDLRRQLQSLVARVEEKQTGQKLEI